MRSGHVDVAMRTHVVGWAADAAQPGQPVRLAIRVNGQPVATILADLKRPDLAGRGFGTGQHGFRFTFDEPLAEADPQTIEIGFADTGETLPNGKHTLPRLAPAPTATPRAQAGQTAQPILVTAPGRSGTSFLMRTLARSPAICIAETEPYEVRFLSYYATVWQVLRAPANHDKSTHPDRLQGDGFHAGSNPFNADQYSPVFQNRATIREYFDTYAPARLLATLRDLIAEYYRRLAADQGKPAALFAEKNNNLDRAPRDFARLAFDRVREIVIVRDPRDVLCSHMAYFGSPPATALNHISHAGRQILSIRGEHRDDVIFVRYEDMLKRDPASYAALSGFLGTDIAPPPDEADDSMFRRHATSASPEQSVGRWRTHLSPESRAQCSADWREFLAEFSYEL